MSEKQRRVLEKLSDKYPHMDAFQKGYLEGTVNTAAAMSTLTDQQRAQQDEMEKEGCIKSSK